MATLYVSYLGGVEKQVAYDIVGSETITTSGTSAQSAAIPQHAGIAVFYSDTAHYVLTGTNPTATATTGLYIPANFAREISIKNGKGNTLKIAAITA